MYDLGAHVAELEARGMRRRLRLISGPQGPRVLLDGKPVVLLCSNNYLGLADHPRVRQAAADGAKRWGVGAGASRLVCGSMTIHRRLEERLAAFEGTQSCLLFGSGYLANTGTIQALCGNSDVIFSDELNHASIIDGCRLSGARTVIYRHCDPEHLALCLASEHCEGERLIVSDSVFSMDGDIAPLEQIIELAEQYDARVMIDEAHATGALGPCGRGALAAAGLEGEVDVLVGTLGKAFGSYGAYVCAQEDTVQYLINSARSLIFSTAPAPPAVAGALAALDLLEERPHRVERLRSAARTLREALGTEGFAVPPGDMHIIPLVIGDEQLALSISQAASERGVFIQAIRPPAVPVDTTRLRLTVMASHTHSELRASARLLARLVRERGIDPSQIGGIGRPDEVEEAAEPVTEQSEPVTATAGESPIRAERAHRFVDAEALAAPFDIEREGMLSRAA